MGLKVVAGDRWSCGDGVAGAQRVFRDDVIFAPITSQTCTPRNTKTRGTISPGTVQFCYVRSGIGWVIFSIFCGSERGAVHDDRGNMYLLFGGRAQQRQDK